jgi:hypothetical protein
MPVVRLGIRNKKCVSPTLRISQTQLLTASEIGGCSIRKVPPGSVGINFDRYTRLRKRSASIGGVKMA